MRSPFRLLLFLLLVVMFLLPVLLLHFSRKEQHKGKILRHFYALGARAWGIRVKKTGELAQDRPLLLVSNHSTYLDVPVLGAILPVRFTPKADVRSWPVIGALCALSGCVFIDRRRSKTAANKENLSAALKSGIPISIFPEGTTNNGRSLEPFRSSYFSLAEQEAGQEVALQSVTIRYTKPDGSPLSAAEQEKVAWYGDAEFAGHLWEYLALDGIVAEVVFHPPIYGSEFADRKSLAQYCEQQVASALFAKQKKGAPKDAE